MMLLSHVRKKAHPWWIRSIFAISISGEELLRDLFVFALFICSLCPFIPSLLLLLSLSGCRLNLCLFIAAAAELNYGSVCWGGGAAVAAWHIMACSTASCLKCEWWVVNRNNGRKIKKEKKRNCLCLQELMQLVACKKKSFPSLLTFTRCLTVPAWKAFLQCVDRRKSLGGAESRSVGDSGGPIPSWLSHLKTKAAKERLE